MRKEEQDERGNANGLKESKVNKLAWRTIIGKTEKIITRKSLPENDIKKQKKKEGLRLKSASVDKLNLEKINKAGFEMKNFGGTRKTLGI